MTRVVVKDLVKRFGTGVAVNHVTLEVAEGEFLTMLGSSGCGKTTTLRCVAGLEMPSEGQILFDDRDMTHVPPYERSCGMVFQNYALFPHMTVADNVAYGLMAGKYRHGNLVEKTSVLFRTSLSAIPPEDRRRVQEALDKVELGSYGKRRPGELSGGQQQRVALARALVTQPQVLLFDEPLGALDAKLRVKMREEIRRIQKLAGITTLYVTHDQEEALAISDRIAVMNHGIIVQLGSPEELYTRPRTRFIADFIGLGNIFAAQAEKDGRVKIGSNGDSLVLTPAEKAVSGRTGFSVAVRPDAIRFLGKDEQSTNTLPGTVKMRMFMGNAVKYVVQVSGMEFIAMLPQNAPRVGADEAVRMAFAPEDVLLLEADGVIRSARKFILFGGVGLFLGVFLVVPMLSLLWVSFTGEPVNFFGYAQKLDFVGFVREIITNGSLQYYHQFFTDPRYYKGLVNSVIFSGVVTLGSCVLGGGLALILARVAVPWKPLLRVLSIVPLAIPPYLMALSFIILFGKAGIISKIWMAIVRHDLLLETRSWQATALVQMFAFFPVILLTTTAALERMDPSLEEAAGVMGARRSFSFWTVTLPLLLPGVLAGSFLTFIRSFGDFATPMVLMPSHIKLIVVEAYRDMSGTTYWGGAAMLSTVMVAVTLVILGLQKYFFERNRFETLTGKATAETKLIRNPLVCGILFVVSILVLGFPLLNLAILGLLSVTQDWGALDLLPSRLTLDHYAEAFGQSSMYLLNSLKLSSIALVLALAVALAVAYTMHRTRFWGRHVLDFVTLLPFIVPGTAFAVGLVTVFNEKPLDWHLTVKLVIAAYVVTRAPYAIRSIMASFQQIGPSMEESSKTLGGTSSLTLWKVLIPLIRPGILAGGIMIFISCMTDVAITLMVCPPAWHPASLSIFDEMTQAHYYMAAAYGLILMTIILIPYGIMLKVVGVKEMSL